MKFRIKYYKGIKTGYVVEVQKRTWYGSNYWTHFILTSGLPDEPWYHSEYKYAEMNMLTKIKRDCLTES